jgi:hypothetical protein
LFDGLYQFLRGSIGFSLLVAGISLFLAHGPKERAIRAIANIFIATGLLFCLSALDKILMLPLDLDNFLLMGLTYLTGRSLLEITLFLFGNERHRGAKKRLNIAGAIVTAALFFLPFLDYAFGWQSIDWNVEDGLARGPIHAFSAVACYAWPLAVAVLAVALAKWKPSDLPIGDPEAQKILVALAVMVLLLAGILVSLGFGLKGPYRICHISMEGFMLVWYFYVVRHPHYFVHVRDQIGKEHKRRFSLGKEETAGIHAKLEGLARNPAFSPPWPSGSAHPPIGFPAISAPGSARPSPPGSTSSG